MAVQSSFRNSCITTVLIVCALAVALAPGGRAERAHAAPAPPVAFRVALAADAGHVGRSGALRARIVMSGEILRIPLEWGVAMPPSAWYRWLPTHAAAPAADVVRALGADAFLAAPDEPGVYILEVGWDGGAVVLEEVRLIVRVPATEKRGSSLNGYRIGRYPSGAGRYAPPAGFIEVTPENRSMHVSRNFQLQHFLTKDQFDVWPKYVLIDPLLLDKLELVIAELRAEGVRADRMFVMSGYRTPQYNSGGVGSGRSAISRHQYGDAADVWIEDADRPGTMADLNGDGRIDEHDARVILRAVERVEARHPELIGGAGVYRANAVRGPFLHIDVRGQRVRW